MQDESTTPKHRVPRVTLNCRECKRPFQVLASQSLQTGRPFCSPACAYENRKTAMEARFWAAVNKTDNCWLWTRALSHGYGILPLPGHAAGYVRAHCYSYELHVGPIPKGLVVRHRCPGGPNRACVNPAHLRLGTQADNVRDTMADGNHPRGETSAARLHPESLPRGEQHKNSKLTEADVRALRARHAAGGISCSALARERGMSFSVVCAIIRGDSWKHVK